MLAPFQTTRVEYKQLLLVAFDALSGLRMVRQGICLCSMHTDGHSLFVLSDIDRCRKHTNRELIHLRAFKLDQQAATAPMPAKQPRGLQHLPLSWQTTDQHTAQLGSKQRDVKRFPQPVPKADHAEQQQLQVPNLAAGGMFSRAGAGQQLSPGQQQQAAQAHNLMQWPQITSHGTSYAYS